MIRTTLQPLKQVANAGWNVLFPSVCAHCATPLDSATSAAGFNRLCPNCKGKLAPAIENRCARCSAPVGPYLGNSPNCSLCRDDNWAFDRALSLGVYEGPLRSAVLRMKSRGGEPLAAALAELLAEREQPFLTAARFDAVVPVPHHWWDRVRSPHLAPQTIARFLATRLQAPVAHAIVSKVRHTPPQAELTKTERLRNLTGAFEPARRTKLDGQSVLVVEDVMTTGQTAHRVSVALRKAGAKSITVAVIARAI